MEETSKDKKTFYITTPIYYVNDVPHIGHAYTTIIADSLARFQKLAGKDVFFMTGTDEHGQKIEKAAAARGISPKELADIVVVRFQDLWKALDIEYDRFIRTTDPRHEAGIQKLFARLLAQGDIYKGTYKGWYCSGEENFLAEEVPVEKDGTKICPDCGRKASVVSEETYFFRLSAYQDRLLDFYEKNPDSVRPQSRLNEVRSFVRQGLKDLSITRTSVGWGIPVPGDPKHTVYVWFDALHNYLTGIGYDWDNDHLNKFWPADVHLIGKDILRFHAVFWPAFLMAGGFPLPKTVFGHGWWLKDDSKMSKSKGNVLDPHDILKFFGPDPLRYFLLREIPIGQDGNFSHEGFIHRVNSDLANDLGNLVSRTLTMVSNYFDGVIEAPGPEEEKDRALAEAFVSLKQRVYELYDSCYINRALEEIWAYLNTVNRYLAGEAPWKLAKTPEDRPRLARVLLQAAAAVRGIAYLVYPVMPGSMKKVWACLGEKGRLEDLRYDDIAYYDLKPGRKMEQPVPLFPRVALKDFLGEEKQETAPAVKAPVAAAPAPGGEGEKKAMEQITYEEFRKMELRVAKVLNAERVPKTDKLLKLEIDLGTEKRTMVAGVAESYAPEALIGKKFIVIINLKPAVIRGIESQAMLLAASEGDIKAVIPFFDGEIPPGALVK